MVANRSEKLGMSLLGAGGSTNLKSLQKLMPVAKFQKDGRYVRMKNSVEWMEGVWFTLSHLNLDHLLNDDYNLSIESPESDALASIQREKRPLALS